MIRLIPRSIALQNLKNFSKISSMIRTFNTAASSADHKKDHGVSKPGEPTLYNQDSNMFLVTKYLVYQLCRFPLFVKNASKLTNGLSKIFGIVLVFICLGKKFIYLIIEKTMGKVFTAGRSIDDLSKEIKDFQRRNIYSVADLSIEGIEKGPKEVNKPLFITIL